MKKILIILISYLFICGCDSNFSEREKVLLTPYEYSPQEFYDKGMTHSVIKDSIGHTLIFHEKGRRDSYNYSFSIEHSPECELCLKIFD